MPLINGHKQRENDVSDAELKAVERNVLGGRRILWAGLAAVLAPLAMSMALQYWWLTELEHNSAIARKATLNHFRNSKMATRRNCVWWCATVVGTRCYQKARKL